VFDNVEDPAQLTRWSPAVGGVQVVVTTVRAVVADLGQSVDVGLFTTSEAVTFLRQRTGLDDDNGAVR
jgi:hypothetical protein